MSISNDRAAGSGLPEVTLLSFPSTAEHARSYAARIAPTTLPEWTDSFAPIVETAVELLELPDDALATRLSTMRDTRGKALVGELLAEFDHLSGELTLVLRGLAILDTRIKGGLKRAGLELPREA